MSTNVISVVCQIGMLEHFHNWHKSKMSAIFGDDPDHDPHSDYDLDYIPIARILKQFLPELCLGPSVNPLNVGMIQITIRIRETHPQKTKDSFEEKYLLFNSKTFYKKAIC